MEQLGSLPVVEILWNLRSELQWIMVGAALAGVVRGFSGFGTAMVFLPFASSVVEPVWALIILCMMDIAGPSLLVRKIAIDANPAELWRLSLGAALAIPFGIALLETLSGDSFRHAVSWLTLALVAIMASGWRYRGTNTNLAVYGIGGLGGLLAGSTGLPGPPVILLYLARPLPPKVIRANLFVYLLIADLLLLAMLAIRGHLTIEPVVAGAAVAIIYFLTLLGGSYLFGQEGEGRYRMVAYLIIAGSAALGLANPVQALL